MLLMSYGVNVIIWGSPWLGSNPLRTRRSRSLESNWPTAFTRDNSRLAVAVGAVAGRAKPNGRWHTHRREARSTKGARYSNIPRCTRAVDWVSGKRSGSLPDAPGCTRAAAARRWSVFEATLANLIPSAARIAEANDEQVAYAMARIEVHYFRNNRYQPEDQLLNRVDRIRHLPATIVQGRYDLLCPPNNSRSVARRVARFETHRRRRRRSLGDGTRHTFVLADRDG